MIHKQLQVDHQDFNYMVRIANCNAGAALISWKSGTGSYYSKNIYLARSGSDTKGTNGLVANNAPLGAITFNGDDGGEFAKAAVILGEVDGTSGADDLCLED